jgi:hypothetical protein
MKPAGYGETQPRLVDDRLAIVLVILDGLGTGRSVSSAGVHQPKPHTHPTSMPSPGEGRVAGISRSGGVAPRHPKSHTGRCSDTPPCHSPAAQCSKLSVQA